MSKRKEDRQQQILRELAETPTLRIGDMARTHGVSTETIRRDLDRTYPPGRTEPNLRRCGAGHEQ
ncbi:DeoR family transcriptional regulator [Klebsiella pneumoniae]|uniref:DeoR family transcriptional regulator n=1 Tax=Klebsiella pneumoniae TaxID=573 RepID=UPI002E330A0E|nr:DeoR family transcriptional regulator [Klebsiella pneumoniae]